MPDREKVLKALEHHKKTAVCIGCPYAKDIDTAHDYCTIYDDAIALLREQEPVKPNRPGTGTYETVWSCGVCGYPMPEGTWCACPKCGRKVKWND